MKITREYLKKLILEELKLEGPPILTKKRAGEVQRSSQRVQTIPQKAGPGEGDFGHPPGNYRIRKLSMNGGKSEFYVEFKGELGTSMVGPFRTVEEARLHVDNENVDEWGETENDKFAKARLAKTGNEMDY